MGGDMFDKGWKISEWTPLLMGSVSTSLGSEQWANYWGWALDHFDETYLSYFSGSFIQACKMSQTTNTSVGKM